MESYKEQAEAFAEQYKKVFESINDYNSKVISFGFVAFFAMAALLKDSAPEKPFIFAMGFMSVSVAIFIIHEIIRFNYLAYNVSNRAKALESLPDENPLKEVENAETIFYIRMMKYHKYFFIPSLATGLIALAILFYCYWVALLC